MSVLFRLVLMSAFNAAVCITYVGIVGVVGVVVGAHVVICCGFVADDDAIMCISMRYIVGDLGVVGVDEIVDIGVVVWMRMCVRVCFFFSKRFMICVN